MDAEDWQRRYVQCDTPWDLGAAHPELAARIAEGLVAPRGGGGRALVGGCGRGHDALALGRAGWTVTAIDLVDATGGELARELARLGGEFRREDALLPAAREPYDLVFEHTFFCAIEPAARARWGELVARVLAPGGRLCALVFPVGKSREEGGPPYGTTTQDLALVLPADVRLALDVPVLHRAAKRAWPERWAEFAR